MIVLLCCFCVLARSFSAFFFGNVYFLTTGAITHNVMFLFFFFSVCLLELCWSLHLKGGCFWEICLVYRSDGLALPPVHCTERYRDVGSREKLGEDQIFSFPLLFFQLCLHTACASYVVLHGTANCKIVIYNPNALASPTTAMTRMACCFCFCSAAVRRRQATKGRIFLCDYCHRCQAVTGLVWLMLLKHDSGAECSYIFRVRKANRVLRSKCQYDKMQETAYVFSDMSTEI